MHSKDLSDVIFVPLGVEDTREKKTNCTWETKENGLARRRNDSAGGRGRGTGGVWQRCTKEQKKKKDEKKPVHISIGH